MLTSIRCIKRDGRALLIIRGEIINKAQNPMTINHSHIIDRRAFLKGVAGTSLLAGLTINSLPAFAKANNPLEFRIGQAPLLLHYNENSLGMSPKALAAGQQAIALYGNRYVDQSIEQLRSQLAINLGVAEQQVLLGNGSTEVIGAVVAYAASQGAKVIEPTPTFGDVRRRAASYGLEVVSVPVGAGFVTDIQALRAEANRQKGPLLINICNPNNPTGSIVDTKELMEWIQAAPQHHLFLVDEAYFEYAQSNPDYASVASLIQQGKENLVITRTFSKIYGMAGMRVGYGAAAPKTAESIGRFASSFNLSAAGVAAAIASLDDKAFYAKSLASNQQAKSLLINTLDELDLEYVKSSGNFVLHRINSDLASYTKRMGQNGIKVGRKMTESDQWNRISLGQVHEMQAFTQTLKAFRQKGWV